MTMAMGMFKTTRHDTSERCVCIFLKKGALHNAPIFVDSYGALF